jgi:hypothetical protein
MSKPERKRSDIISGIASLAVACFPVYATIRLLRGDWNFVVLFASLFVAAFVFYWFLAASDEP